MTYADDFDLRTYNVVKMNDVADAVDGLITRGWGGTSGGTATAYTVTPSPAWTAYTTGDVLRFTPHTTGTGAATVNVSSLGTKTIRYCNRALVGGELYQDVEAILVYDGTYFNLLNHGGGWATWTPTITGPGSVGSTTIYTARYQIHGKKADLQVSFTTTTSGTAGANINASLPFTTDTGNASAVNVLAAEFYQTAIAEGMCKAHVNNGTTSLVFKKLDHSNWGNAASFWHATGQVGVS